MEKEIPKYGFKLKLDYKYPLKWNQIGKVSFWQALPMIGLVIRYLFYWLRVMWSGRRVLMDYIFTETGKQIYGVPIGGIGGGSIGRGFRGEFCRFQLNPGVVEYNTVPANNFIVTIKDDKHNTIFQSVLAAYEEPKKKLSAWQWLIDASRCSYTGLYPRSWTEYDLSDYGIKLICRQISPVIPRNYKDSSLPCAVFIWEVENVCSESRTVTVAFTFKNGTGDKKQDSAAPCWSKSFTFEKIEGVVLHHMIKTMPCTYGLAAKSTETVNVSKCLSFDPNSTGEIPWHQLYNNGKFDVTPEMKANHVNDELACGIACQSEIKPKAKQDFEMCLVWDMPIVTFFNKTRKHKRFYTKYFGVESASGKMAEYALGNYTKWESDIYQWQKPILEDSTLPDWYKAAIFNELYYVSDGGTCWFTDDEEFPAGDPRLEYGRFSYLEGHEYRMYNTYDVHFYASYALAMNWPELQVVLQYDMNDFIPMEIKETRTTLFNGEKAPIKPKNTVPHDVGDPFEEPFTLINAYPIHDVSDWRDLNLKFVLQVYRDYVLLEKNNNVDRNKYLKDMFEAMKVVMAHSATFDKDGDGLIENGGFPDQTYDSWIMSGPSAYCGGLWLAALKCMSIMCEILEKPDDKKKYDDMLAKGRKSFEEKVWNGKYYRFDGSINSETIMSDQLCGHWYLRCCGLNYEVFPQTNVKSALKTVYDNNVQKFAKGERGAVNGFLPKGEVDKITVQSEEVWLGVTYALASTMIYEGMQEEGFKTAGGMFKFLVEQVGQGFESPEAFNNRGWYRAIGYMRPLSIWSMQLALQNKQRS